MAITTDHQEQPAPGACPCGDFSRCPRCMGKLQQWRHEWALNQWIEKWGNRPRPTPRARPLLRLVQGGR